MGITTYSRWTEITKQKEEITIQMIEIMRNVFLNCLHIAYIFNVTSTRHTTKIFQNALPRSEADMDKRSAVGGVFIRIPFSHSGIPQTTWSKPTHWLRILLISSKHEL